MQFKCIAKKYNDMVVRESVIQRLNEHLKSKKSEFIAITGRRRVGKTYIIDTVYESHLCFRLTGIQNGTLNEQLVNFTQKLISYSQSTLITTPKNWQEAFILLKNYLLTLSKKKKHVLFIDELPWVNTVKSSFLQLLAHLWNDFLSKENNYILVVCGSSTSWITKKIIRDKGGLHNRLTDIIRLKPFTIQETKAFLNYKGIHMTNQQVIETYMIMGGIPYYLNDIRRGESIAVAVERMCFMDDGILKSEYDNLYKALYDNPQDHEMIVTTLATSRTGLTRQEIINKSKVLAGGPYQRAMEDLLLSGFVTEEVTFGNKKKGSIYRLNDEYSIFYHRFIKSNKKYVSGIWLQISASQTYKIWTGYAFENLIYNHISTIKSALGIASVFTEISAINVMGTKEKDGYQIDLIIDRKDATINICELKYYNAPFEIDKKYAEVLRNRKQKFIMHTGTRKQVFTTMITNLGIIENPWSLEVIDKSLSFSDLL